MAELQMESELGFVVDGRGHRRFHRLLNNSVALFFAITEAGSDSDALDAIGAAVICAGCAIHSSIKGCLNNMNSNTPCSIRFPCEILWMFCYQGQPLHFYKHIYRVRLQI